MFHGSIVALLTPMRENGDIDYLCLRNLVDWHIAQRTDAILVMGTTGEPATLNLAEQNNVIKTVVEQAHGQIPVIAGTGTNCTQSSVERTKTAMEIGVDACLLVTPYYNCPTQEGLYQHYRVIAEKVPIPQILYNVPKRTGVDLLPETVSRLAGITNIIGIKEGRPEFAKIIIECCGTNMDVYCGDDNAALEMMGFGSKGLISVLANLLPKTMHDLYQATKEANWDTAEKIDQRLQPLYESLFLETNPIAVKWLASEFSVKGSSAQKLIPTPYVRLPLTTLSPTHQDTLRPVLALLETFT
jgi:4-hydroxy-tetrahydrodipicolinate synthase